MPLNEGSEEVQNYVFQPTEPMDGVKHFSFRSHFGGMRGMAFLVLREFLEGGTETGLHCHDDAYTLTVIRAGRGTVLINDHPYGLVRGDVYIIPPGHVHGIRDYQGIELDGFYFQAELFTRGELAALRQLKGFWKLLMHNDVAEAPVGDRRLHLSPERHREIDDIILKIHGDLRQSAPAGAMLARHQFYRLLVTLALWHSEREHAEDAPRGDPGDVSDAHAGALADVVRYCEEKFAEPITVPQLAARMFLSPDHFSRLFTSSMGIPPAAFLRRLRLQRAQTLLRTTSLPIADIARQSGMRDPFQLARSFRAAFGSSPSTYRAKYRK